MHLGPVVSVRDSDDLPGAFEVSARAGVHAALRMVDPMESALRRQTIALADQYRLPIIYPFRETVELGGLAAYGTNAADQYRQAATFVHKVLHGPNPAELPIAQPTKFDLVINLKTAKALGLTVPQSLLARADEVIE